MEKQFDPFIFEFEGLFDCNFEKIFSIVKSSNLKHASFNLYLNELDIFKLTTLFKLSSLTKSVILSYFFINKKINYKTLYKLSNLEYNYQQKRWGIVEEHLLMNKDFIESIKNISFFFKNIS
jgi:chaperone required for assembly of F1-ATPase